MWISPDFSGANWVPLWLYQGVAGLGIVSSCSWSRLDCFFMCSNCVYLYRRSTEHLSYFKRMVAKIYVKTKCSKGFVLKKMSLLSIFVLLRCLWHVVSSFVRSFAEKISCIREWAIQIQCTSWMELCSGNTPYIKLSITVVLVCLRFAPLASLVRILSTSSFNTFTS